MTSLLVKSKLYWGILAVFSAGVLLSPEAQDGTNIFLSAGNLTEVLRQVSIIGIVAVGMTLVILTAGIDLSVGSVMALGSTLCAMLLTQSGWHHGAAFGLPALMLVAAAIIYAGLGHMLARRGTGVFLRRLLSMTGGGAVALAIYLYVSAPLTAQIPGGVGTLGGWGVVFVVAMSGAVGLLLGALSGVVIAKGRLQPFIVTLAMMVSVLGLSRLMAGQDQSVYPVYTGSNAPLEFEILRASIHGMPVPGTIFLVIVLVFVVLLGRFRFGRAVYALGGNEKAAHLAGVNVARVKIWVYALTGMLASLAGVLYAAQYRQGKPDVGAGLELDAIAAVVIGGASLMGGRGTLFGTLAGVLIFGFLNNIFQLNNIDSNMQLVLKGAIIVVAVLLQESQAVKLRALWGKRQ
jgi:simple sugar transport system permease protein